MSNKSSKAETLHDLTLDYWITRIKAGDLTAQEMESVRKFLQDQGVSCIGEASPKVNNLLDELPVKGAAEEYMRNVQ